MCCIAAMLRCAELHAPPTPFSFLVCERRYGSINAPSAHALGMKEANQLVITSLIGKGGSGCVYCGELVKPCINSFQAPDAMS